MVYKNFKLNLLIRTILIALTLLLAFITIYDFHYVMAPLLLIFLAIIQFISIFQYIQKTNMYLTTFLDSIRYADFSRNFKIEGLGSRYDELKSAFNQVIDNFQKIRTDKEEHFHYLQNVIQHVGIGLIAFNNTGEIELINNSARKIMQVYHVDFLDDLAQISDELPLKLNQLKSGDRTIIQLLIQDKNVQLVVYATEFKIRNRLIKLVSLQNIQSELEEQEMAAWQKLISVLTHEIMNSITPIASLSATVNQILKDNLDDNGNIAPLDNETIDDIRSSLLTINKRSTGLIRFVESYRSLTKIPKPKFNIIPVNNLFQNLHNLLDDDIQNAGIYFNSSIDPYSLELTIDQEQIEQVLINLIKNAMHALTESSDPKIELKAFLNEKGRSIIQISDNGPGIIKDVIDKIFIPFFTTKSNGSGIGLSLSKQIMRAHGGTITVNSIPYENTTFTLIF